MRVLSVHNRYQQRGGEDESVESEVALLRSRGHEVIEYSEHNDRIRGMWRPRVAARTVWSHEAYRALRGVIRESRPDVVHVQNFFPLISPSAYYAAKAEGVAVVQSLRNYRLLCLKASMFRDGRICEDCLGRPVSLPGVRHACYRGSRAGSAAVAAMQSVHRLIRTWKRMVHVYVALTEFSRAKFVEGGLPAELFVVKPNFVFPDPGARTGPGEYAVFVGRLSEEKGLWTLLEAWRASPGLPLRVVGDGPLLPAVERFVRDEGLEDRVRVLGRLDRAETMGVLRGARFLVCPSEWYEPFGRVVAEALACGVPALVSDLGSLPRFVDEGRCGRVFEAGNAGDLLEKARILASEAGERMGRSARRAFEVRYSAEANYPALVRIYESALARQGARQPTGVA